MKLSCKHCVVVAKERGEEDLKFLLEHKMGLLDMWHPWPISQSQLFIESDYAPDLILTFIKLDNYTNLLLEPPFLFLRFTDPSSVATFFLFPSKKNSMSRNNFLTCLSYNVLHDKLNSIHMSSVILWIAPMQLSGIFFPILSSDTDTALLPLLSNSTWQMILKSKPIY